MRLIVVCAALVIALPGLIGAQEPVDTMHGESPARFYVAGGLEFARFTRYPASYAQRYGLGAGLSLQAGYTRQFKRLGFRLGLAYFEREREYGPSVYSSPENQFVTNARTIAANLDLTYDLTRSRIRPYLIGGLAPYWVAASDRYARGTFPYHQFAIALSPGVGVRVPLRSVEVFVELRRYYASGYSHVFSPLTLGVRF